MRNETLTLLCFSYAGGSAKFYSRWKNLLPNVRVIPVEIPGRSDTQNSAALLTRETLISFLLEHYLPWCVPPFAFFGHSLGARIAFEFLWVLEQTRDLKALCLFASACLAPERFASAMRIREQDLSDSSLLSVLTDLGGTPPELMSNSMFIDTELPIMRADFQLAINLSKSRITPIATPIHLLLGSKDKVTNLFEDYPGWKHFTTQACRLAVFDGDHFYIRSQMLLVAKFVNEKLQESIFHDY